MILPKETIYRYMRHIIMPEISGPGQKKLLESTVLILAASAEEAAPLLLYLTASGIGHIKYHVEDAKGSDGLAKCLHDLNPEILIEKVDSLQDADKGPKVCTSNGDFSCRIIFGEADFINHITGLLEKNTYFIPTIFALPSAWNGIIQSIRNQESLEYFSNFLNKVPFMSPVLKRHLFLGNIFSRCLLGTLAAVETIKICLNLKGVSEDPLYFNLLTMDFKKFNINLDVNDIIDALKSSSKEISHDIKSKLAGSKVLIVGTGGLGCPAAYALAQAGVGTLGLLDRDKVEISNLNRQILHSTSRIGMPKVKSAETFLKKVSPDINVISYETLFAESNAFEILKDFDVIIDGVDNLPTRYLLNDACFLSGKPLAEAGVLRFDGLGMTILPQKGHCYRCVFPKMPAPGSVPSCSESGILGPVPGVMGIIEAAEAIKIIAGMGKTLINRIIMFDALELNFRVIDVKRDDGCPLCGQNPSIKNLLEYKITCEGDVV